MLQVHSFRLCIEFSGQKWQLVNDICNGSAGLIVDLTVARLGMWTRASKSMLLSDVP